MGTRYTTVLAIVWVLALAGFGYAQAQAPVPELTESQKLQIQVRLKDIEILQLKFEAAKGELLRLLATLQRDGYELDLTTGTYKPLPKVEPKP